MIDDACYVIYSQENGVVNFKTKPRFEKYPNGLLPFRQYAVCNSPTDFIDRKKQRRLFCIRKESRGFKFIGKSACPALTEKNTSFG